MSEIISTFLDHKHEPISDVILNVYNVLIESHGRDGDYNVTFGDISIFATTRIISRFASNNDTDVLLCADTVFSCAIANKSIITLVTIGKDTLEIVIASYYIDSNKYTYDSNKYTYDSHKYTYDVSKLVWYGYGDLSIVCKTDLDSIDEVLTFADFLPRQVKSAK